MPNRFTDLLEAPKPIEKESTNRFSDLKPTEPSNRFSDLLKPKPAEISREASMGLPAGLHVTGDSVLTGTPTTEGKYMGMGEGGISWRKSQVAHYQYQHPGFYGKLQAIGIENLDPTALDAEFRVFSKGLLDAYSQQSLREAAARQEKSKEETIDRLRRAAFMDPLPKKEPKKLKEVGTVEQFRKEKKRDLSPFVRPVIESLRGVRVREASLRWCTGDSAYQLQPETIEYIERHSDDPETTIAEISQRMFNLRKADMEELNEEAHVQAFNRRPKSLGAKVVDMVTNMIPWGVEFYMGGVVARGPAAVAEKGVRRVIGHAVGTGVPQTLKRVAIKTSGWVTEIGVRTGGNVPRWLHSVEQEKTPYVGFDKDNTFNIVLNMDNPSTDFIRGHLKNLFETGTETLGGRFKSLNKVIAKLPFAGKIMQRLTGNRVLNKAGISNIPEEILEEDANLFLNWVTGIDTFGLPEDSSKLDRLKAAAKQDLENFPAEVISFWIPIGLGKAAQRTVKGIAPRRTIVEGVEKPPTISKPPIVAEPVKPAEKIVEKEAPKGVEYNETFGSYDQKIGNVTLRGRLPEKTKTAEGVRVNTYEDVKREGDWFIVTTKTEGSVESTFEKRYANYEEALEVAREQAKPTEKPKIKKDIFQYEAAPRKQEALAEIKEAISEAPEKSKYKESTHGNIDIAIDGGLTIPNNKEALQGMHDRLKALPEKIKLWPRKKLTYPKIPAKPSKLTIAKERPSPNEVETILKPIKATEDVREFLKEIHYEDGYAVALDGRVLYAAKGYEGKKVEGYPDWKRLVERGKKSVIVDVAELFHLAKSAGAMIKKGEYQIANLHINPDKTLGISGMDVDGNAFRVNVDKKAKLIAGLDHKNLGKLATALAKFGHKKAELTYTTKTDPLVFFADEDKATMAPMKILEEPEEPTVGGIAGLPREAEEPSKRQPTPFKKFRKPISTRKIIDHLSKALGVPIRGMVTHRPRKYLGWYSFKKRGIRQINSNSLRTAAHEVGHHIDWYWNERISKNPPKGTADELLALGKKLYGDKAPAGGYKSEGYAEFIRGYILGLDSNVDIENEAPNFYKWFMEEYLPNNSVIANPLNQARQLYEGYVAQGAEKRIESMIEGKPPKGTISERLRRAKIWWMSMWTEEAAPLLVGMEEAGLLDKAVLVKNVAEKDKKDIKELGGRWVENEQGYIVPWDNRKQLFKSKLKGWVFEKVQATTILPEENPYDLYVFFRQKEGARARQMVMDYTMDIWGGRTGKGLSEILEPVSKQIDRFMRYMVAARVMKLHDKGKNPGISNSDATEVFLKYDTEEWAKIAEEVTDWNGRILDYLIRAGQLKKEDKAKFRDANPIYIPFMRSFKAGEIQYSGAIGQGKMVTTAKAVKGIGSSGRPIVEPLQSVIRQTQRMISIAHKSMVARALAGLEAKKPGLAGLIWEVPAPKKATTFNIKQIKKDLARLGYEKMAIDAITGEKFSTAGMMSTQEEDTLLTVFSNSPIFLGKENVVSLIIDGKRKFYEVSPELFRVLNGLDTFRLPRILDFIMGKPTRLLRLGATGLNASFGLIRNPMRDALTLLIYGRHAKYGPFSSVKGMALDATATELAKKLGIPGHKAALLWSALGGKITGFIGQDRRSTQHLRGEMLATSWGKYVIHNARHPVDALRELFGIPEAGPRIAEFVNALKSAEKKYGEGNPNAVIEAFNASQDVTLNFSRHGVISKWLNGMIPFFNAGVQDISKLYRMFKENPKETALRAITYLTLPALGLWWKNKDEDWYKNLPAYEKANYVHFKVPGKDTIVRLPVPFTIGHIFMSIPVAVLNSRYQNDSTEVKGVFAEALERVVPGDWPPWPAAVRPVIETLMNRDWAGRAIVPKGAEGRVPSQQYKDWNTKLCKEIGKILNISPAKLEYLLNSYSGGLYGRISRAGEFVVGKERETVKADWPVIGTLFVRDPYAPKAQVQKFYDELDRLNRLKQSDMINLKQDFKRRVFGKVSRGLSLKWKQLRAAKTVENRKRIYSEISELLKIAEEHK